MIPDAIDLRAQLPGARDQGSRPTCLAFAVSDAHALAAVTRDLLSAEYLHFHATRRAGVPLNAGVGIEPTRDALRLNGQPLERECAYAVPRDDGWIPPQMTTVWKRDSSLVPGQPSKVLALALRDGRADVLVLGISRSFFVPDAKLHLVTEDGASDRQLHAVVVVGLASLGGVLSFLVRNSWGTTWGLEGHAWLAATYVDARAREIIAIARRSSKQ
jgi:Papain family cysteine protease